MPQSLRRCRTHFNAPTIAIAWRPSYLAADQQVTFPTDTVCIAAWPHRQEQTSSRASLRWEMEIALPFRSIRFIRRKTVHSRGRGNPNHTADPATVETMCAACSGSSTGRTPLYPCGIVSWLQSKIRLGMRSVAFLGKHEQTLIHHKYGTNNRLKE